MVEKNNCWKPCMNLCVVFVIITIFIGGIYMLGKLMNHNHCYRDKPEIPNNHSYSDRPTLTFRPFIENNPKVRLKWNTTSVNGSSFVYYNPSTNDFTVTESNILNIRLTFHINTKNLQKEQLNVACIVYSNERQTCTSASFRMGRPIGTLHIKDKVFALPGFSFRVEILDLSMIKKNRHGNSLIIGKSYNSRSELDSNTTVKRRKITPCHHD